MSEGEDCRKGSLQMLYLEPSLGMYRSSESEKVRSVGSDTLDRIPISLIGRYYSQGGEASQAKALGQLQEIVDREKKFFTRNTGFATNTGFEEASLETAVSHHSNSKMNQHEHEAHVAQQFRHDKMRISEAYSFPPLTCFPNQRCAFSSVALQQPTQLEMQLANSELSGTLGHLKCYSGSSVDETTLGNVHPTYSSEAAASGDYAFSSGIDLLDIPSRGENLLKASVSDMLQRPSEVALAYTSQTAHRDGLEGHSEAVESKWTNWIFPERNLQYHPISTLGNFGGLQSVQGSAVPEAGQRATNSLISSLLAGPNMQEGLLNATARNASFGSVHTKNASDETVQPYLMSGHSDLSNLKVNTNHFASGNRNQQQYDLISSLPSLFTQKPSTMQPLSSDISTSAQERFYSSQNLLNTGDYNQRSKWGNGGSELVLLPGSTNVGLNQSRSSDPLGSMKSIGGTGPLYGSVQAPLPFAQWERQGQTSENSGRSLSTENFTIGNLRQGQGLSLSLSSQQQSTPEFHGFDTRIPHAGSFSILRNSKFAKAAQQLLHEFCNVGRCEKKAVSAQRATISQTWMDGETTSVYQQKNDSSNTTTIVAKDGTKSIKPDATSSDPPSGPAIVQMQPEERSQLQMKKSKLVAMVEEVERRYRQYHDQIQMVITSFESAMGLRAAAPYTALARQVMSRNFRCLRDAITGQIHAICEALGEELSNVPVLSKGETPRLRILDRQLRHQRSLQQIGMLQQQVWRPQRGLPEQSVSVLRAWLFEHFLHPYPKDTEKLMLARQTSLTRSQVSNWFINARVRLWKPMVEEMYVEESKEAEFQAPNEVGSSQMNEEGKSKILESDCGLQAAVRNADIKQERKVANDGNSTSNSIQGASEQDHTSDPNSSESEYASGSSRAQQASGVFNSVSAEPSVLQRAPGSTLKSIDAGMDIQDSAPFFPPKDVEMRYEGAGSEQGVRMHERQQNMERGSIVRDSPYSRAEGSVSFELKDGGRPTKGPQEGLAAQTQLRGGSSGVTLTLGLQQHFSSQNKKSVGWAK